MSVFQNKQARQQAKPVADWKEVPKLTCVGRWDSLQHFYYLSSYCNMDEVFNEDFKNIHVIFDADMGVDSILLGYGGLTTDRLRLAVYLYFHTRDVCCGFTVH